MFIGDSTPGQRGDKGELDAMRLMPSWWRVVAEVSCVLINSSFVKVFHWYT